MISATSFAIESCLSESDGGSKMTGGDSLGAEYSPSPVSCRSVFANGERGGGAAAASRFSFLQSNQASLKVRQYNNTRY